MNIGKFPKESSRASAAERAEGYDGVGTGARRDGRNDAAHAATDWNTGRQL